MYRALVMILLVGCASTLELPEAAGPDAPPPPQPLARMQARVHDVSLDWFCDGPHGGHNVHLELVGADHVQWRFEGQSRYLRFPAAPPGYLEYVDEHPNQLSEHGECWSTPLVVGDTVDVDVGRMPARVVDVREEGSNCGGSHVFLEVVVDGHTRRLRAGGHCLRTMLAVGDTVTVDAVVMTAPIRLPNPGHWLPDLPAVDGFATVVSPANAFTRQ